MTKYEVKFIRRSRSIDVRLKRVSGPIVLKELTFKRARKQAENMIFAMEGVTQDYYYEVFSIVDISTKPDEVAGDCLGIWHIPGDSE